MTEIYNDINLDFKLNDLVKLNLKMDPLGKPNPKLEKKMEQMKKQNFKSQAREASFNWRSHVPVYGWTTINYPTSIQRPLREKYQEEKEMRNEENKKKEDKENSEREAKKKEEENKQNPIIQIPMNKKKKRINPELVNQEVMKEMEVLVPIDYSENFLHNYPKSDFAFLKKQFADFANNKNKIEFEPIVPQVFNKLIADGENKFLYQLGIKSASTYLSTMDYEKKCKFVDSNQIFDEKYCTMFPKSAMLGPKPDPNYENRTKKIGDISFEEDTTEGEGVKNLSRLPPENITEEWVKDNLNDKVTKINFANCYWLSKDLVSKLGRLDSSLKIISLRNLDLSNYIVENIIVNCKSLEELDISNCTGLASGLLDIIAEKGKKLVDLNISNLNGGINDSEFINIGYKLKNLKKINLSRNLTVTDKGIKGILCHGIKLNTIDISACLSLTNAGLQTLFEFCADTLENVYLNFLPKITDDGLSGLSNCKLLKNVEIMGNPSDVGGIISVLSKLVTANLSGCSKLTDNDVNSIIGNNGNLRILRVSNCIALTNNILENIIEKPNQIMLLEINRTPSITDDKIRETMEKKKPNFRIIRATNIVWSKKNLGLTVPYPSDNYEKPFIKGSKKPAAKKKNEDKSPENQLMKLREEMKPKMIYEFFQSKPKAKKKGKKKK